MNYRPKHIEEKWRKIWKESGVYEPDLQRAKKPFYNLMMFPYPSAEGLHAGNMYAFVGSDIYGRYKRMRGHDVFEPIGLDGFGIHSENYAINIGAHPAILAKKNEERFYKQLERIGNGFSWNARLETYDPAYYRWTQWLFTQMFERGLAYRKKATVHWCPSCLTVLADEQVLPSGACERCDTAVTQRALEQWFFRITDYAEYLLNDIERIDWSENVKIAQRNWIGKSEGALIPFEIQSGNGKEKVRVEIFTTRADTLFGATFIALSLEYERISDFRSAISNQKEVDEYIQKAKTKTEDDRKAAKEKTGVEFKGIKAIHPATKEEIPVWVADYVLAGYGTGAIMAVPAHDDRDLEFAEAFGLPIRKVIEPLIPTLRHADMRAFEGEGVLVNSGAFDGMRSKDAKTAIVKKIGGTIKTQYHLRDWLISRQRYWGPPIPLVFCENCKKLAENHKSQIQNPKQIQNSKLQFSKGELENPGWIAVDEENLPVLLPNIENFRPTGTDKSPLATVESFIKTTCPKCGGEARRETDVSDTFLDSAWYYIGYLMTSEKWTLEIGNSPFSHLAKKWLPVDMYIGGAEHAVLHLLYARFVTKALHDWGFVDFEEPFKKFRAHGLLIKDGAKMSKSKGNVVSPDEYCEAWGVDTVRMFLMFLGPFHQGGDFRDSGIVGIARFLKRAWEEVNRKARAENQRRGARAKNETRALQRVLHQSIKKITEDIERLHYNTAIAQLMILANELRGCGEHAGKKEWKIFLKLLAPFAPFIAEELWALLGEPKSIHSAPWPEHDPAQLATDRITIIVQINGKMRDTIMVNANAAEETIKNLALASERVRHFLAQKAPSRIVVVSGQLVNIVIE